MSAPPRDSYTSQLKTLEHPGGMGGNEELRWPCLTILFHPDLRRVGECAILGQLMARRPVELSRKSPAFMRPNSHEAQPLRDPYLSRRPVILERAPDHYIDITPAAGVPLEVDDQRVEGPMRLRYPELDQGVILQLSHRVILLFHLVSVSERPPRWGLVGESEGICQVRRQISQVADLDVPVFIRGETGVGKERVAQAIHAASQRAGEPCISVNMAAYFEGTATSELFGHAKGAFTGATERRAGVFERADGGTLFLDEVGETPFNIQPMLLRALAEGKILPVGEANEREVDVRIIAATDANIEQSAAEGTFREALFHRLTGYEIRVPPLRARREDIPRLVVHFLEEVLAEVGESWRMKPRSMDKDLWFPPELMRRLCQHAWPGNVRQLANVVRQLVISSRRLDSLTIDETVQRILSEVHCTKTGRRPPKAGTAPTNDVGDDQVFQALQESEWAVSAAAEKLGLNRHQIYKAMDRHPHLRRPRDISREEIIQCARECRGDIDEMVKRLRISRHALRARLRVLGIDLDKL